MADNQTDLTIEDFRSGFSSVMQPISDAYHGDDDFRARVDANPHATLGEMGLALPAGRDVKVVTDGEDMVHFVMPSDPNAELADTELVSVAGGDTASSAGTAGTIGTLLTTVGSASSVGTAGTAG